MYASIHRGGGIIFLWLLFTSSLIYYASDKLFFENHNLFYNTYGNQLDLYRIDEMIEQATKWKWVGYLIVPLVVFLRVTYTTVCVFVGCFLNDIKVKFSELFTIAILADFVFIVSGLLKLIMLIFFKDVNTLGDLQVQPLSILNLFDISILDPFYKYPLSVLNIFEVLYVLVLVWMVSGLIGRSFLNSFKTIATSYGTGIFLWLLFVMFMNVTLN